MQQTQSLQELLSQLLIVFAEHKDLFMIFVNFLPPFIREQAKLGIQNPTVGKKRGLDMSAGEEEEGGTKHRAPPHEHIVGILGGHSTATSTMYVPQQENEYIPPTLPPISTSLGYNSSCMLPQVTPTSAQVGATATAMNTAHGPFDEEKKKIKAFQYVFKIRDQLAQDPDTYQ